MSCFLALPDEADFAVVEFSGVGSWQQDALLRVGAEREKCGGVGAGDYAGNGGDAVVLEGGGEVGYGVVAEDWVSGCGVKGGEGGRARDRGEE